MDDVQAKEIQRETKETYNRIAELFSSTRDYVWNDLKPFAHFVEDGDTVLDVGCGNGRLYQLFKENQVSYLGLDQSEKLVSLARETYPNGRFFVADMTRMPIKDASIDVIFAVASFHHLTTRRERVLAFREIKRVLKRGGTIILLNWHLYSDWARGKGFIGNEHGDFNIPWRDAKKNIIGNRYYHGFTPDEIVRLAENTGFEVVNQFFSKSGEHSNEREGDNIVTIMRQNP